MSNFISRHYLPPFFASLLLCAFLATFASFTPAMGMVDQDGDGIPDQQEQFWGTDPAVPDLPVVVFTYPERSAAELAKPGYDPSLAPVDIAVTHVAEDRYLWRVSFAANPNPDSTVLHIYMDSDNNRETGRKGGGGTGGVDHMFSAAGGMPRLQLYPPDGNSPKAGMPPYIYVNGKNFYMLTDVPLPVVDNQATVTFFVLCHGTADKDGKPSPMNINSGTPMQINIAQRPGSKISRITDRDQLEGFNRSYGIEMIRKQLYQTKGVVFVPYDKLDLHGFEVNLFTQHHFGHVHSKKHLAETSTTAPKGRFHAGFLTYDFNDGSKFAMSVDGDLKGFAPVDVNNRRYWFYWLQDAIDFQGTETVSLTACGSGAHQVAGIVFFPAPPPGRALPYNIHHLTTHCPPETSGEITLSWITEMPSPTRLEFGTKKLEQTIENDRLNTVHRAILTGLDPKRKYSARAVGIKPDGTTYTTPIISFQAQAKAPGKSKIKRDQLPITVRNSNSFPASNQLITNGFPFPEGALANSNQIRVLFQGREIPAQIKTTAWWPDNSVKWILVSFIADQIDANTAAEYTLEYGSQVQRRPDGSPIASLIGGIPYVYQSAPITFSDDGELLTPDKQPCRLEIKLAAEGLLAQPEKTNFSLEDNGPVRAVIVGRRQYNTADGEPAFLLETRYTVWKNSPAVNLQQTFIVQGKELYTLLEDMTLNIPTADRDKWSVLNEAGQEIALTGTGLHQHFDQEFENNGTVTQGRLTGAAVTAGQLVNLRNFWQTYPKAYRQTTGNLQLALCPDFESGRYDAFPFEKEGHHLYFYLLNGVYKFRAGMAKTDEIQLAWGVSADEAQRLAKLHQRPLLAMAPPQWYCDSNAFYPLAVKDTEKFKFYEQTIDRKIDAYEATRERLRDYGLMNFGDWFGERGANWGNSEYDTQSALLLQYVRSGNEKAFFLADDMEKHNRDVDTVHWSKPGFRPGSGSVMVHQMGHVGGYYKESVPGTLGIPRAGTTVSHAWTEGHFYHYFLTGDVRSRETALGLADYYIENDLAYPYQFVSCRNPGWHLILNAATLASTGCPYYLNASRVIIDRVLELQDNTPVPVPDYQLEPGRRTHHEGGWSRMMVPGHCHCEPRHRGNANFMVAVLLSGMKYYHDVTADPRVKRSIIAGARSLVAECYSEEAQGFRYTSCPNMRFTFGTHPLMVEGIARAYLWTKDPDLRRPLTDALLNSSGGADYGKGFSNYYRMAPRVLHDLAQVGITWNDPPKKPEQAKFKPPAWMTGKEAKGQIIIEAEDFTGEDGGTCQTKYDRQATSNAMITYWEAHIGHWLEWEFELPQTGKYEVIFRYATSHSATLRKIEINGKVPSEAAENLAFERTGSYGMAASDWKFLPLPGDDGKPMTVTLPAGKNKLRMTNMHGGLGLDFILLKPMP